MVITLLLVPRHTQSHMFKSSICLIVKARRSLWCSWVRSVGKLFSDYIIIPYVNRSQDLGRNVGHHKQVSMLSSICGGQSGTKLPHENRSCRAHLYFVAWNLNTFIICHLWRFTNDETTTFVFAIIAKWACFLPAPTSLWCLLVNASFQMTHKVKYKQVC